LCRGARPRIIAPMRNVLAVLLGGALGMAYAQDGAATPAPRARPPQQYAVDGIVATVNDIAIRSSEVLTLLAGYVRTEREKGQVITPQQLDRMYRDMLDQEIDRLRMAQAAMSLGTLPPEQVEQILRDDLARDQQQLLGDLGTFTAVSKELKRRGTDWPTWAGEQRIDRLSELAKEFTVYRRLQRQQNLFLTPRMLRETFRDPRFSGRFRRPALADLVQVGFTGPDARARAEQAAALWRTETLTARQLADRFPGARALPEMEASSLSEASAAIAAFALAGPAGAVSQPLQIGDTLYVVKVTRHAPARDGKFEDRDVQAELRLICYRSVVDEFHAQAREAARQRTEVWDPSRPRQ
jgi:hypothetical protein